MSFARLFGLSKKQPNPDPPPETTSEDEGFTLVGGNQSNSRPNSFAGYPNLPNVESAGAAAGAGSGSANQLPQGNVAYPPLPNSQFTGNFIELF